ncbi:cytochrome-c peroxidase [Silvimonas amylolytica]|uniref:Di-heme cytochrome c peroxidase n=1 Tax=Silvimonas amylolytica TaxID=449663 RepID=A0ABQ2PHF3_9NEIS|nr:cytochrome c peroxidase [Silvimonas amylolytica]GGP24738.1 di-heme cytochrome c peroxidase [Silvimonas amylolytica]
MFSKFSLPPIRRRRTGLHYPLFVAAAVLTLGALYGCKDSVASQTPAAKSAAASQPAWKKADYAPTLKTQPKVADMTALGKLMFYDVSLSGSGKVSCATCHSADHAYGPPNNLPVQMGGKDGNLAGTRAVPSLRYLQTVPNFSEHFFDDDGDDSVDAGPTGGHNWDGRARTVHDQARIPLLAVNEMANASAADVAAKVAKAPYAGQFRKVFGEDIFKDPDTAFKWATMALEVFQETPTEFYPYSSKYDAYLRHQIKLSPQEMRGLQVFNDEDKGNCASCHISAVAENGAFPNFSDFGLIALGVPRNMKIPANVDPAHFDMGACGPDRTDLKGRGEFCGLFRTPSLRNVATRKVFMHNGEFTSLEQVVRFYNERDTNPAKWYPRGKDGKVIAHNDLPDQYKDNLNQDPPFGRKPGQKPAMSEADIRDVVAFMKTLTDGYTDPVQEGGKLRTAHK